jgi:Flp pilus assembly secretin CpaC
MTHVTRSLSALALAVLLQTGPAAMAADPEGQVAADPQVNVLVTVRLAKLEGQKRVPVKSYDLVVVAGAGNPASKLLSGERVPIPTESSEDGTSIVYQNIGFLTEVRAWIVADGRIKLIAEIEDSRLNRPAGGGPPVVETRQLSVSAILKDGDPLVLTRVEGISDQSGLVEVEATLLP